MNKIIRLKSLISSILVVALLNLCGCYSFSALTEEEIANNRPNREDDTKFILKDGSEIIYEYQTKPKKFHISPKPFLVRIDEPSDLIYGRGSILYKGRLKPINFWGEIPREKIDSTSSTYIYKQLHQQFWLTNGNCVTLKEGYYAEITPGDGVGYWVSGRKDDLPFNGKIDFGEINEIQVDKVDWLPSMLLFGLCVGAVVAIIIALKDLKIGMSGWGQRGG